MKWISVKDRLPNLNEEILIFVIYNDKMGCGYREICTFLGNCYQPVRRPTLYLDEISHWMPLPEPPKS